MVHAHIDFSTYDIYSSLSPVVKLFDVVHGYAYEPYIEHAYLRIEERGDAIKKN